MNAANLYLRIGRRASSAASGLPPMALSRNPNSDRLRRKPMTTATPGPSRRPASGNRAAGSGWTGRRTRRPAPGGRPCPGRVGRVEGGGVRDEQGEAEDQLPRAQGHDERGDLEDRHQDGVGAPDDDRHRERQRDGQQERPAPHDPGHGDERGGEPVHVAEREVDLADDDDEGEPERHDGDRAHVPQHAQGVDDGQERVRLAERREDHDHDEDRDHEAADPEAGLTGAACPPPARRRRGYRGRGQRRIAVLGHPRPNPGVPGRSRPGMDQRRRRGRPAALRRRIRRDHAAG